MPKNLKEVLSIQKDIAHTLQAISASLAQLVTIEQDALEMTQQSRQAARDRSAARLAELGLHVRMPADTPPRAPSAQKIRVRVVPNPVAPPIAHPAPTVTPLGPEDPRLATLLKHDEELAEAQKNRVRQGLHVPLTPEAEQVLRGESGEVPDETMRCRCGKFKSDEAPGCVWHEARKEQAEKIGSTPEAEQVPLTPEALWERYFTAYPHLLDRVDAAVQEKAGAVEQAPKSVILTAEEVRQAVILFDALIVVGRPDLAEAHLLKLKAHLGSYVETFSRDELAKWIWGILPVAQTASESEAHRAMSRQVAQALQALPNE